MSKRSENYIIAALAVVLIAVFGFRIYKSKSIETKSEDFALLLDQLRIMEKMEGVNILSFIEENERPNIALSLNEKQKRPKFVVLLSDSSCSPCFANFISNYINDLRESEIEIDASQWYALFVGQKRELGELTFKGTFGDKATLLQIRSLNSAISLKDAYILFLDEKNFIVASSKVYNFSNDLRLFFSNRVANYLNSAKI